MKVAASEPCSSGVSSVVYKEHEKKQARKGEMGGQRGGATKQRNEVPSDSFHEKLKKSVLTSVPYLVDMRGG